MPPDQNGPRVPGVTLLVPRPEPGAIDRTVMAALYAALGQAEADRQVAASVDAIALWLIDLRMAVEEGRMAEAAALSTRVAEAAAGLGLTALATASQQLIDCQSRGDSTALLAVLARQRRLGEQALGDILGSQLRD